MKIRKRDNSKLNYIEINELLNHLKLNIRNYKLEEAFRRVEKISAILEVSEIESEILLLETRYNRNKQKIEKGIETEEKQENKIIDSFITLVGKIEVLLLEENASVTDLQHELDHFNKFFKPQKERRHFTSEVIHDKSIALFNYEVNGIMVYRREQISLRESDQEKYSHWLSSKRNISESEVLNGTWIKMSQVRAAYRVRLFEGGKLKEWDIHDLNNFSLEGNWNLEEGVLNLDISGYKLSVFASKEGILHSGIEFSENWPMLSVFSNMLIPFKI